VLAEQRQSGAALEVSTAGRSRDVPIACSAVWGHTPLWCCQGLLPEFAPGHPSRASVVLPSLARPRSE
jgi:hypothetical protein